MQNIITGASILFAAISYFRYRALNKQYLMLSEASDEVARIAQKLVNQQNEYANVARNILNETLESKPHLGFADYKNDYLN